MGAVLCDAGRPTRDRHIDDRSMSDAQWLADLVARHAADVEGVPLTIPLSQGAEREQRARDALRTGALHLALAVDLARRELALGSPERMAIARVACESHLQDARSAA